jgi:hypothetical protein
VLLLWLELCTAAGLLSGELLGVECVRRLPGWWRVLMVEK